MKRFLGIALLTCGVVLAAVYAVVIFYPHYKMAEAMDGIIERAGGANRFVFEPLPDATWRTIVKPSPDLAYGAMTYDLTEGPLVIEAPALAGYWSLQFVDDKTNSFGYAGSRMAGDSVPKIRLSRGENARGNATSLKSPSNRGIVIVRYLVREPAHFGPIDRLRRQIRVIQEPVE